MVGKTQKTQSEPHGELAEYSRSITFLFRRCIDRNACIGSGGRARRSWPGGRGAAGCLCFGKRSERNPVAIGADGAEHSIRSCKNAYREMEDRRRDQETDVGG